MVVNGLASTGPMPSPIPVVLRSEEVWNLYMEILVECDQRDGEARLIDSERRSVPRVLIRIVGREC
jgi:hypothetical protein